MLRRILSIVIVLTFASVATAQLELDWYSFDAGGRTSGGNLELTYTIGQPEAVTVTGGPFEFTGGFWSVLRVDESILGDMDCDGDVDMDDVAPFVLAIVDSAAYEIAYSNCIESNADLNGDQAVDGRDIQGLVDRLLN